MNTWSHSLPELDSGVIVGLIVFALFSTGTARGGLVQENTHANIILAETLLTTKSDNFFPDLTYGGSEEFVVINGIIDPDTMVAFYWRDPLSTINDWRSFYLEMPLEAGYSLGRYKPSSVTVSDSTIYIAVSTDIFVYQLRNNARLSRIIELPVCATHLEVTNDTLYFGADKLDESNAPLGRWTSRGFYGYVPLNEKETTVEYWPIEEPLGLVMGLFQPRSFMALRGSLVAWVKSLGDSLIIESRGARITSYSLNDICNTQISEKLQRYITDTNWMRRPTPATAIEHIRAFYKNYDLIRRVSFATDSLLVIDVVHGEKYDTGLNKGRNITKLYYFRYAGGIVSPGGLTSSVNPSVHDKPALAAPLSQHMTIRAGYAIAIEPCNVRWSEFNSYSELARDNEEATKVSQYSLSIQLRSLK